MSERMLVIGRARRDERSESKGRVEISSQFEMSSRRFAPPALTFSTLATRQHAMTLSLIMMFSL